MEKSISVEQNKKVKLFISKRSVDWLVNNTTVSEFDPISFTGYQRKIDEDHCNKIIDYIKKKDFDLPTAIICATSNDYNEDAALRIVDGQHRVHAFRLIRENNKALYDDIKDKEIAVVVMENKTGNEGVEIDTFISINKSQKKVDTSLAYVLKNKLNAGASSSDLTIPKRDYLAVEVAYRLNYTFEDASSPMYPMWYNLILFEGMVKNSSQVISLNAFVKSTRTLLSYLEKVGAMSIKWHSKEEINHIVDEVASLLERVWKRIQIKWPTLFVDELDTRRIIQGAIGYSSINRYFNKRLQKIDRRCDFEILYEFFCEWVDDIDIPSREWLPSVGSLSKYSSETGYSIVANELLESAGILDDD